MHEFGFALREGIRSFLRDRTLSFAMAGSVAIAVFALGTVALAAVNIDFLLREWEGRVELVAFLPHETDAERSQAALQRIRGLPEVKEAKLVSGQESWRELFAEDGELLNLGQTALDEILPPTIVIQLNPGRHELLKVKELSSRIGAFEGVDEVKFEEVLLERYFKFRRDVAILAIVTNIFWLLVFGVITVNIARLASAARAAEIHAMHLLGADSALMRKIFSIESILQGTTGALVGVASLGVFLVLISQKMNRPIHVPILVVSAVFAIGPLLAELANWRMFRKAVTTLLVAVLLALPAAAAVHADELDSEVAKYREELERLRVELAQSKSAADKIAVQERTLSKELKKIDGEIDVLEQDLASATVKMATNKSAINAEKTELAECEEKLSESRGELEQWLKLLCIRKMPSVAEVIFLDIPQSKITLRNHLIELLAQKEAQAYTRTEELRARYREQQDSLRKRSELDRLYVETAELRVQRLLEKKKQREDLLAGLRQQKSIYAAAINDLEASSRDLQLLLDSAQTTQDPKLAASVPFREMKGMLPWPAAGEVVAPFGRIQNPDLRTYTRHLGIDISSPAGSEIRVVHDGVVLFSDWFGRYGKLIIIDHGGGYSSIYSHCSDIFVKKGDFIRAGARLALVGDTGSLKGALLYFEIRENGQPVDPLAWLQRRM